MPGVSMRITCAAGRPFRRQVEKALYAIARGLWLVSDDGELGTHKSIQES